MKMPRSHSENENVQFVQELAEVDGPFESPININFRDLTKLELPSLVWNRSDASPKKMKITNTGHTVIVSGKWKSERPYLTGGPLLGKYVFSQIHFHWGQDDCKGSEHLVCGEGFPLEMHVAHFKADYISQECALKEKDGMVVLVYLFKLQDEPNTSLKKILNCLPSIRQANSSQPLDPRPILSLCNPFTDDYFMYWGSVVTSTCAHILMWLVCREPFGISKEQVNEFRKLLDSSHQPISKNNKETQPLHKRNVFHVNASKNLDSPLLPVKKIVGCFCGKGSEDNDSVNSSKDCCCKGSVKDQEDVQGAYTESNVGYLHMYKEGGEPTCRKMGSQTQDYHVHQSLVVQRATVQSAPMLPKVFENTYIGQLWPSGTVKAANTNGSINTNVNAEDSNAKLVSQSCCFIPMKEVGRVKSRQDKRRSRQKSFNSMRALSHIMDSLEALKNQTCKKLKEIDSINQQIKGMKSFCQEPEDKKWLRRIEKIMSRQRRFTMKSSQGCLVELKKLAKDCNIEQLFENKFSSHSESTKMTLMNKSTTDRVCTRSNGRSSTSTRKIQSKSLTVEKALKFSSKAQKLIQSFFEDIHDSEDLQQSMKNNFNLKKKKSLSPAKSKRSKESSSTTLSFRKGYITKKMFKMGNLGDRFFIEVKSDDTIIPEETGWGEPDSHANRLFVSVDGSRTENPDPTESDLVTKVATEETSFSTTKQLPEDIIPLHRADVAVGFGSETQRSQPIENLMKRKKGFESDEENHEVSLVDTFSDSGSETFGASSYGEGKPDKTSYAAKEDEEPVSKEKRYASKEHSLDKLNSERLLSALKNLASSTDSSATQRMIIAKFHKLQSREEIWDTNFSLIAKSSSKVLSQKGTCKRQKTKNLNFEGYYIKRKNRKSKKQKVQTDRGGKGLESSGELSSVSKEDLESPDGRGKWKNLKKARFKLKIEKTSDSTIESALGYSILSPTKGTIRLSRRGREGEEECDDTMGAIIIEELQPSPRKDNETQVRGIGTPRRDEPVQTGLYSSGSRPLSRASTRKSTKMSSKDSKTSSPDKTSYVHGETQNESFKKDYTIVKKTIKNRSFTNLSGRFKKHSSDTGKRIFVQANEDRCKSGKDSLEYKRKTYYSNTCELAPRERSPSKEIKLDVHKKQILDEKLQMDNLSNFLDDRSERMQEYEVGFFTTSRQKRNEKLLNGTSSKKETKNTQDGTGKTSKNVTLRCDIEKYHFLAMQDLKDSSQNDFVVQQEAKESRGNLLKTDSNKSVTSNGPNMKGDANAPSADPKDLPPTVSYTTIKKSSQSRPHSVESLTSLTKSCKRKRKKRPHCSKRISRHHMRKNSCVFRKPNKVDSKHVNFLNLTDEEQLKIISVNVAKYLKQKLVEQKRSLDIKKETDDLKVEIDKEPGRQFQSPSCEPNSLEPLKLDQNAEQVALDSQLESRPIEDSNVNYKSEEKMEHSAEVQISSNPLTKSESSLEKNIELTVEEKREETPEVEDHQDSKEENNEVSEQQNKQEMKSTSEDQFPKEQQLEGKEINQELASYNMGISGEKTTEKLTREINETKLPLPIKRVYENFEKLEEDETLKADEGTETKTNKGSIKTKKPGSPRPPLNFIKLNKLMAGKYKRQNMAESKPESNENLKKTEEPKTPETPPPLPPPSTPPTTPSTPPKKTPTIKSPEQKRPGSSKSNLPVRAPDKKLNKKPPKGNQARSPEPKKNPENPDKKNLKKKPQSSKKGEDKLEKDGTAKEESPVEANPDDNSELLTVQDQSFPLEKTPSTWVPTYMMTSYVTPSLELSENSQKINPFLLNVKKKNSYLPDVLYDSSYYDAKGKRNDTIYSKDLENLIKLQMCLNNEIAANIENSMNYIKTLLSQDYNGCDFVEKTPVNDNLGSFDPSQNGIVLIEMNDLMDCSTSGSDCGDETDRNAYRNEGHFKNKFQSKIKEILNPNGSIPKEYGDSKAVNSAFTSNAPEPEEDYYSDSSYNCEISITLNGNSEEPLDADNNGTGNDYQIIRSAHLLRKDSTSSQMTAQLDGGHSSQSIVFKPLRKKRKDNEISMEMKKKLLEILEGEIRREMSLNYQASSENSSDALTLRWDESTGTNRSQSFMESSSENTEVLAQISETMRQYLSEYKKRRLVKKNLDAMDKSKSEDDS